MHLPEHVYRVLLGRLDNLFLDPLMDRRFDRAHESRTCELSALLAKHAAYQADGPMLMPFHCQLDPFIVWPHWLTAAPSDKAATSPRPSANPPEAI